MLFDWFAAAEAQRFGKDLAQFVAAELMSVVNKRDAKFTVKAEKVLRQAAIRVQEFKSRERLNVYKKAKLANAFLWELKDRGCPADYADELADWLAGRL
jgi:hypothetical protein